MEYNKNNKFGEKDYGMRCIEVKDLKSGDNLFVYDDNLSNNSLGDITSAFDFNKPLSPEKIGHLSASDNATYGASLSCGANCFAFDKSSKNCSEGIKTISLTRNSYDSLNSCSDKLLSLSVFDLCFLTSSSKNSGAINLNLFKIVFSENIDETIPLFINDDITTLASTTNLSGIFYSDNLSYFLDSDKLISSANSSACSFVNCDFETICLNRMSFESLSIRRLLASIDNSIFGIVLNSDSNSSGILIFNSSIDNFNGNSYIKLSNFDKGVIFEKIIDKKIKEANVMKKENKETIEVISMVRYKVSTNFKDTNYLKYINIFILSQVLKYFRSIKEDFVN